MLIVTKRVYDGYAASDGYRVLVDRLWPRGLTKERVHADEWAKDVAPSTELRKAFGHNPAKWKWFEKAYIAEVNANPAALALAKRLSNLGVPKVTLLYAAKNESENEAIVLQSWLKKRCL